MVVSCVAALPSYVTKCCSLQAVWTTQSVLHPRLLAVKQAPVKVQRELQAEDVEGVVKRSASMCLRVLDNTPVQ